MNNELDRYWDEELEKRHCNDREFEPDLDECGFSYEHGCQLAATEYCDWECPFHDEYQKWLNGKSNDSQLL